MTNPCLDAHITDSMEARKQQQIDFYLEQIADILECISRSDVTGSAVEHHALQGLGAVGSIARLRQEDKVA